jgi:hypothetical protein
MNKTQTIRSASCAALSFNSNGVYASDERLASIAAECLAAERANLAAARAARAAGANNATWHVNW